MDHIFSVVRIHAIIITTFLWKIYGPRGIDITSFLGGLVKIPQRWRSWPAGLKRVAGSYSP